MRRVCYRLLLLLAIPAIVRAQAMVEYAVKSATGAVAASGGSGIGGCKVDSGLLSCLGRSYPKTAIVLAVVLCLLVLRRLAFGRRYR